MAKKSKAFLDTIKPLFDFASWPSPFQTLFISVVAILISLILFCWGSHLQEGVLKTLMLNIASVLLAAGVFSWLGSYLARREIRETLIAGHELSMAMQRSGIKDVVKWDIQIPSNCCEMDALLIRGASWFGIRSHDIVKILKRKNGRVRICLLHPKSPMVDSLATKFDEDSETVIKKINDSIKNLILAYADLKRDLGGSEKISGSLEIRIHKHIPHHSYYRLDDDIYFAWYKITPGRMPVVPMLRINDGELGGFFANDFDTVYESSTTVFLSSESRPMLVGLLKAAGMNEGDIKMLEKRLGQSLAED